MERGNFKQSHNIQEGNEYYSDAINNENHINEEDTLTKNKYESNNTNRRKINRKLKTNFQKNLRICKCRHLFKQIRKFKIY